MSSFRVVVQGLTNKEIAERLLSAIPVRTHCVKTIKKVDIQIERQLRL